MKTQVKNLIFYKIKYFTLYYLSKILKKGRFSAIWNSRIDKTSKIESGSSFSNSVMGRYSFCGYDCEITNTIIGNFTSIANNVVIGGATHPMEWVGMSPVFYSGRDSVKKKFTYFDLESPKDTLVGNDVWIGRSAIIISGVNIGDGSVIGAGSVVTKDVPPYAIVAGNPARVIRFRFDKITIERLVKISWWNFNNVDLKTYSKFIKDPNLFINTIETKNNLFVNKIQKS